MAKWTSLREAWSDARDKAGLKKGAVPGVSLGDAIDKVVRGQAKGYAALSKACDELKAAADKYKAKISKSHPELARWIDKEIGGPLEILKGGVAADLTSLKWITKNCIDDVSNSEFTVLPDMGDFKRAVELMVPPKNLPWAEAVKIIRVFDNTISTAPILAKRGAYIKKITWHAKLVGHDAHYRTLIDYADFLVDIAVFAAKWSKVSSAAEYQKFVVETRTRPLAQQKDLEMRTAVAALMT